MDILNHFILLDIFCSIGVTWGWGGRLRPKNNFHSTLFLNNKSIVIMSNKKN